ncbi:MAG: nucleotidyl transferase AbiEii/AbiGii toxin family protein [Nitrospirae bacterium]|nr:nucleotidyl transferase AbiEii/AbiGii toxin family protein [Nitrospirota bacterium]
MFYEEVFRKLGEQKIRYAVAGGVALVLHGIVRLTADLDLILDMKEENLTKFIDCIKELGFRPRVPVQPEDFISAKNREEWKREKGMKVFTFFHPPKQIQQIDVFIEEYIPYEEIEKELVQIPVKDISIPVISIRHLKALKTVSARAQDIADIAMLNDLESMGGGQE